MIFVSIDLFATLDNICQSIANYTKKICIITRKKKLLIKMYSQLKLRFLFEVVGVRKKFQTRR